MKNFLIGRQQILDENLDTVAYEILLRDNNFDLNHQDQASSATDQVISDIIVNIGLNNIVQQHRAFINFTAGNLLEKTPLNLPKDRIVIEVLEDVEINLKIIALLRDFSQQGYTIALDDFVLNPQWRPLLEFVDIIKLDIMQMSMDDTLKLIEQLKPYELTLLAEKVETKEEFQVLKNAGCQLFQGFFFNKPEIISGKRSEINQTAIIDLLAVVNNADAEFDEIAGVISKDAGLTYNLLNYINSAFFALPSRVETIPHAISLLGLSEIKRWTNILSLSALNSKPQAVLQNILIRAKMCEQMAEHFEQDKAHMFLIGLLSGLDIILDMPLDEALEQLPLADNIIDAILNHENTAGQILAYVLCYEKWDFCHCPKQLQLSADIASKLYLQSIEWSQSTLEQTTKK